MPTLLLEAKNLKKHFPLSMGLLMGRTSGLIRAVDDISFAIQPGATFSLVGESGCGKTTTAKLVLLLERPTSGSLFFDGDEVCGLRGKQLRPYRRSVQAVFQDPSSSLNPRMRVGSSIAEPLVADGSMSRTEMKERIGYLLQQVGLNPRSASLFPHEFSGGQRQRIALARALATNPRLIILDEPVSALDISIRAQIMNLLKDLQQHFGLTYFLIAHNMATVRYMSTFVAVMYLGKIVESAPCEELYTHPLHPYTQALLSAALPSHPSVKWEERNILIGEVPSLRNPQQGCCFYPRCPQASAVCSHVETQFLSVTPNHNVACHLYCQA